MTVFTRRWGVVVLLLLFVCVLFIDWTVSVQLQRTVSDDACVGLFLFFFLSLPLSFSLTGHVSTSCQMSRGGEEDQMWTCGWWQGPLLVVTSNWLRAARHSCAHLKFGKELGIESWSLRKLHCLFWYGKTEGCHRMTRLSVSKALCTFWHFLLLSWTNHPL